MVFIKIVGILCKKNDTNYVFVKNIISRFNNINVIGLFPFSDYTICDGFIIQGGRDIENWYYDVVSYAIRSNKPILGICLGCQVLGTYMDGTLKKCSNHLNTSHEIINNKNSFLYNIFGSRVITNSRHRQCIDKLSSFFHVSSISKDNVIEAIEYNGDTFIVGVQFHPEDLDNMKDLFDKFVSYL